jgi:Fanconi anemia group M protein
MAPTKPLTTQHQKSLQSVLNIGEEKVGLLTGYVKPEERKKIWQESTIITATPQTIESDLLSGRLDLKEVGLMIVDEAHRAVGDYAYCYVSKKYVKQNPDNHLILAITASPGSEEEKISDVCRNLYMTWMLNPMSTRLTFTGQR